MTFAMQELKSFVYEKLDTKTKKDNTKMFERRETTDSRTGSKMRIRRS